MRRLPLRTRLTGWFAFAVLAVVTPYGVAVLALEWQSARRALDHHLAEDLEVAAQMLRPSGNAVVWVAGEGHDPGYDAGDQRWVEVFAMSGEPLYARGIARNESIRGALPPPRPGAGHETTRTPGGAHVRLLTASRRAGDLPVVIRVARSEDQIRGQWATLALIFLLTIPLAVLAAAGAGHMLAGRALAPISRMAEHARTITAERLHERLPVDNPSDEIGGLAIVFNRTIERLEDAFDRLRRFTADASHELRTPLTALRTVGEVGLRGSRTPTEYRDIVGSMLEEADRLTRLIDSLLMLSRFDAQRVRLAPERIDLAELAAEAVAHLGVLAEEKRVELRLHRQRRAVALADRQTLRQALINVLDNAIKYSAAGEPVDITTSRTDGTCALTVADRGPGIPAEHHGLVFDRFYRVDKARTRDVEGNGLGLAIAQWAVTANGGAITLESAEGEGSRFTIRVPAADPDSAGAQPA
jgi:heavy metal sensor kinase